MSYAVERENHQAVSITKCPISMMSMRKKVLSNIWKHTNAHSLTVSQEGQVRQEGKISQAGKISQEGHQKYNLSVRQLTQLEQTTANTADKMIGKVGAITGNNSPPLTSIMSSRAMPSKFISIKVSTTPE